jgi:MarR family transcriptional regulator, organic hydroperoxide resistance regulator
MNKSVAHAILEKKSLIDSLIHRQHHLLAQKHDLSLEQFHLLIELDELMVDVPEDSGLPVGQLASHTGNAQNTISERITRLENKSLVTRVRDASDRRINRITLTTAGRELIETIGREAGAILLRKALETLPDEEVAQLDFLLGKVLVNLEQKAAK